MNNRFVDAVSKITGGEPRFFSVIDAERLMDIDVDFPEQVGKDRLADAIAAAECYGSPTIVIDMGTGKEQRITITSSTNLSEDEINKKVKEAEQYAEEDKKRKEEVEIRNRAESLIYETEKSLKELEGKISEDEKTQITDAKDQLQAVLNNGTVDQIKEKTEALTEKFHIISTKLYEQAQAAQAAGAAGMGGAGADAAGAAGAGSQAGPADDNVVDADYTVVDDDNK